MLEKISSFSAFLMQIPGAVLVMIIIALSLILFLPEAAAQTIYVDGFRKAYGVYIGPVWLLTIAFCGGRLYHHIIEKRKQAKQLIRLKKSLSELTPEEKGYLLPYIINGENSIYVGIQDGIMAGLQKKGITYRASNMGDQMNGFAFNLQSWARQHLVENEHLLNHAVGRPKTPREKYREQRRFY
ncbi:super-infection exclusion protein B [Serratia sp. TSA_105.2]|uniref:super-infection exclusion protein B n=1 Tax=Serratia sp. TSA_105.2 TaxID=3415660 RepID=UPI004046AB82